ncbi:MAG: hypothetical protein IJ165_07675 [Proteobacteria bacterium]|nr:hypothetical protein [Pseudomonadota bacterium]
MISRIKHILAPLALLALLTIPLQAHALTPADVNGKSDPELAEENWEMREVNANSSTVRCGLLSILISTVWRGYGHYCIGDQKSHYKLLAMEGTSLAMLATSLLMGSLSHDAKSLSAIWKSLFHFGTTLFISSYIIDVFGTFKGNSFNLANNHIDPYGHTIDVQLRWMPSQKFNLGLQFDYTYRNPRFWISPYGFLDVIELSKYELGVDMGVALWYGEKTYTYVALALDSRAEAHIGFDNNDDFTSKYNSLRFLPYVEFSLDLGSWFDHLANFRFINRLGVGVNLYEFSDATVKPFTDYKTLLVLETALSINLIKDLNLAFTYRYRPDYSIGQLSAPSRIFQTIPVPGVGIFSLDLDFRISGSWFASVEANFGGSIDFWLGVSKNFQ